MAGSVEIHYFYFTICWNVFRAFDTSIADFRNISVDEKLKYRDNSKD